MGGDIELTEPDKDDFQTALASAFRSDADAWPLLRRIGYPTVRFPTFGGYHHDAWHQVFTDLEHGVVREPYRRLLIAAVRVLPFNSTLGRLIAKYGVHPSPVFGDDLVVASVAPLPRPYSAPGGTPTTDVDGRHGAFLCHSSGDKEQVRSLHRRLGTDGVECWFDEVDILAGQDYDLEIRRALRRCRYVVVCLSAASVGKTGYLQKELRYALDGAAEQPEGAIFLVPVRLEPSTVPDRLAHLNFVNLFEPEGYQRLLRALRAG